jgi:hypothetical protein
MRRLLGCVTVSALLVAAPSIAVGKKTADSEFHSTGAAAAPGAVAGTGEAGTYEDFPFTIAPDDADGTVTVEVTYLNPGDDWDVYVYFKNSTGGLETVGSATDPPGQAFEKVVIQSQSTPVTPGNYVIRVQNYSATSPNFDGTIKFTDYAIPNAKPVAKLKAPKKAKLGKAVKLDASGSKDSDGSIANYAFDLDGDGSIETDNGSSPVLMHTFGGGVHHVAVRVTDDKGKRAYATRTIRVTKPPRTKRRGNR